MTYKTHHTIALLGGALAGQYDINDSLNSFIKFIIILLTSTLPDIDISLGIKHRGLTHSLICFLLLSFIMLILYPVGFVPFIIGYGTHILADSFNTSGIQLLYPNRGKYGIKLLPYRSEVENYIYIFCNSCLFIYVFYQAYIIIKPLLYM